MVDVYAFQRDSQRCGDHAEKYRQPSSRIHSQNHEEVGEGKQSSIRIIYRTDTNFFSYARLIVVSE